MACRSVIYVTASVFLSCAFLAVGISFFGPYWLSNVGAANETMLDGYPYLWDPYLWDPTLTISLFPDRGLWAQCGAECQWFWGYGGSYKLQHLFTSLKWHLATQVLYFIGAAIILFSEIINRVHACCCYQSRGQLVTLGILVLASVLIQTAAVAVFGGGASRSPYNAISDPKQFTQYLGQAFLFSGQGYPIAYLGWCYWMAVVGDMLSVVAGVLFLVASCCNKDAAHYD
jgi:hypothetical protein